MSTLEGKTERRRQGPGGLRACQSTIMAAANRSCSIYYVRKELLLHPRKKKEEGRPSFSPSPTPLSSSSPLPSWITYHSQLAPLDRLFSLSGAQSSGLVQLMAGVGVGNRSQPTGTRETTAVSSFPSKQ